MLLLCMLNTRQKQNLVVESAAVAEVSGRGECRRGVLFKSVASQKDMNVSVCVCVCVFNKRSVKHSKKRISFDLFLLLDS